MTLIQAMTLAVNLTNLTILLVVNYKLDNLNKTLRQKNPPAS